MLQGTLKDDFVLPAVVASSRIVDLCNPSSREVGLICCKNVKANGHILHQWIHIKRINITHILHQEYIVCDRGGNVDLLVRVQVNEK